MNILLRNYNGQNYVWAKATWVNGVYRLVNTGEQFNSARILAVTEDERIGYVQCGHCGALVKNDPESIEAHYAELEKQKDCMKCDKMAPYGNKRNQNIKCTKNADGTYTIVDEYVSKLGCRVGYYTEDINGEAAARNCIYARCRRQGVRQINDAFVKYPGLFEKQITVDMLNAKKCTFDGYNNGYYEYDLKLRQTLKACVNDLGIVDHFAVSIRGWRYNFYYSDKYKKLFMEDWGSYSDNVSEYMNDAKEAKIIEKISQLYEEAVTNE